MLTKDRSEQLSEFLRYLADCEQSECERLPSLADLSGKLGISIASLREQLEVARAMGLVEVKPKTGIRRLPYTFSPSIQKSLLYAVEVDPTAFQQYADLRKHIEEAYWYQAVSLLTPEDHKLLRQLLRSAQDRLRAIPLQVPNAEHRELHLVIYRRLQNQFVLGILETYWDLYEAVGLGLANDIGYIRQVWQYHEKMVENICNGNYTAGYQTLKEHMDLLKERRKPPAPRRQFE